MSREEAPGAGSDVAALEEPSTRSEGRAPGWITDRGRPPLSEEGLGSCTVGILFSESVVEEPITTRENRLVIGLDRETIAGREGGEAARALSTGRFVQSRRTWRSRRRCRRGRPGSLCPVAADLEEPSAVSESVRVGDEPAREAVGRGGSRGSRRPMHVTIEVQDPWPPAGTGRNRQEPATTAKFGETTEEPGRSGRRPPRHQSLRPRNSSGSVTS